MKATKTVRAVAIAASSAFVAASLFSLATTGADAATRSTVTIMETTAMTSLNQNTSSTNLVTNGDISYLTGAGFTYYDNKPALVRNTNFGTFKIVKNTTGDFEVQYSVKPGQVWSDGTPIDGVDLLLSHVLSSSEYSKTAGLGTPGSDAGSLFDSVLYAGPYDGHVVGIPTLSKDHMSVTIKYDSFQPDWAIMGPGPSPVHALEELVDGKTSLGTAAENKAAKAQFLKDFLAGSKGSNDRLKKMGPIWTTAYNVLNINSSTNPLLLISNGAFKVSAAVANQSVTLVRNAKYTSGPAMAKTNPINKIVFSFIADGAPAIQALANGDIDIYAGQPDASGVAQLKAISTASTYGGLSLTYEHVDLRTGDGPGTTDHYTGPFAAADGQKAKDLRTAFLLALPRDAIVALELTPYAPQAKRMDSLLLFPGQPGYDTVTKGSGVSKYSTGTQAARDAQALALVKKYYPTASSTNAVVPINMLFKNSQRREDENALIATEEAKAGFNVSTAPTAGWSTHEKENKWDVEMFAWGLTAVSQTGNNANYLSDGTQNFYGWNYPALDAALHSTEKNLSPAKLTAAYAAADKQIIGNALSLPLYQWPNTMAANKKLKGFSLAPLSPQIDWNFWQWHY